MPFANNFFIITGGPGSGKTTLIEALKKKQYYCVDEAARSILKEKDAMGIDIKSYRNTIAFVEEELQLSVAHYIRAQHQNSSALTFFDRGIPDIIAHAHLRNVPISNTLENAAHTYRYNNIVFIAPPWREIYCTDRERTESYEDGVQIYKQIKKTYQTYGYCLVELPRTDVESRTQFVLDYTK